MQRETRTSELTNYYGSNNENNIENKKIITFGKCSRFYLLILGSASFKFISLALLGNNNITANGIGLFGFCPTLTKFNFIQSIFIYFGYIIFGMIFLSFREVKKVEIKDLMKTRNIIQRNLIKNKEKKENSNSKNNIKILFFVGLAFVFHIETKKLLYKEGFQFMNFWTVKIIFILHFMRKYFIMDFYKHHKVSIIFIISACSILILTASFLPSSLLDENSGNAYQNIKAKLGSYFYCILFIFIFVILSYTYSFLKVYSKILMQIKFISPYKIVLTIGIIGFIASIISSVISYFINYQDNFQNYFSDMKKVLNGEKPYKFWVEIFCVYLLYSFTSFMELTFEVSIIYYLNPLYVLVSDNLYYGITELITFLLNLTNDGVKITHFLITEFTEIFSFLGYLVYLEILELNFCGLNENLKRKHIEIGEKEFLKLSESDSANKVIEEASEDNNSENENSGYILPYRNI